MKRLLVIISALALTYQAHAMGPRIDAIENNTPANCKPIRKRSYQERHSDALHNLKEAKAHYQALSQTCKPFGTKKSKIEALVNITVRTEQTIENTYPTLYQSVPTPKKAKRSIENPHYRRAAHSNLHNAFLKLTAETEDIGIMQAIDQNSQANNSLDTMAQESTSLISKLEASFDGQPTKKRNRDNSDKENIPNQNITFYFCAPPNY